MDVAVIGLGLIGGSVLRALAGRHRVLGFDADPDTRATARIGAARTPATARWQISDTLREAVAPADLVVLAVPLPALPGVLTEITDCGYNGVVTDVTSVKVPVHRLVAEHLYAGGNRLASFIGGHPMAGREVSGFAAGDARLFDGCAWVLCLEPDRTVLPDWLDLAALLTMLGARVVPTTPEEHDLAVAAVSHVPHLVAAAVVAAMAHDPLAAALAAGSFRDGTRVAASRPELVAAMCGGNAAAVLPALDAFRDALAAAHAALQASDPIAALHPLLAPASAARRTWPPTPGTRVELPARVSTLLELGRAGGWVSAVASDRRTVTAIRPGV